jgi:hypothetical protein
MRRLTAAEYANTVRDLLGVVVDEAELPPDERNAGFRENTSPVSRAQVERYGDAARAIASAVDVGGLLSCGPSRECAEEVLVAVTERAYRRPLTGDERTSVVNLYVVGSEAAAGLDTAVTVEAGVRLALEGALQAPQFLYRVEAPPPDDGQLVPLDGYEIATRLSYLFWQTMPDAALLAAASRGDLDTVEGVRREAERLLEDDRARATYRAFTLEWLALDGSPLVVKDPGRFPDFDTELADAALMETALVGEHAFLTGRIDTLLHGRLSFQDPALRALYGSVEAGDPLPDGFDLPTGFAPVRVDANRGGVATHASVLMTRSRSADTAPVQRGAFFLRSLLCVDLPDPPPSVAAEPLMPDPSASTREQHARHSADPACAGCHQQIDPVGFAFESFDAIGRYRDHDEQGRPIDTSGAVTLDGASPLAFADLAQLSDDLAREGWFDRCAVRHLARFAWGRRETAAERCFLDGLARRLSEGQDPRETLIELATSPLFRSR